MENISTIIICVILAAVCLFALISYRKKISGGCCGSGGGEIKVKPDDKDLSHYPYHAVVYINNMTCANCKMRVENAFNRQDGTFAKVNLKKKYADIYFKNAPDEKNIKETVEKCGYEYVKTSDK